MKVTCEVVNNNNLLPLGINQSICSNRLIEVTGHSNVCMGYALFTVKTTFFGLWMLGEQFQCPAYGTVKSL